MESVAADHLGLSVSSGQVEYLLNKLYQPRTEKGLLAHYGLVDAQEQVLRCRERSDVFFDQVHQWYETHPDGNGRLREPNQFVNRLGPELDGLAQHDQERGGRD